MWDSITSWFTPTILFCFLNLMIGAIFIASSFSRTHNKNHQQQLGDNNSPQLVRAPSLLARVKSINFSGIYKFDQHYPFQPETQIVDPAQDRQNEEEIEFHGQVSDSDHHVTRSKSDTCEETPEPDRVPATMMKKSASEKAVVGREEAEEEEEKLKEVELRRPATATVRERKGKWSEVSSFKGDDDGVDAKADDFINRFKQQLKLQRLESLKRYRDMWGRGK